MIYYFEHNELTKEYKNVRVEEDQELRRLNSRGYFIIPSQDENDISLCWIDPKIYKKSHDYLVLDLITKFDLFTNFVDYVLPKYQREEKLNRILKDNNYE